MPSVRSPQECVRPALTAVNSPSGALVWPCELSPQQVTVPPVRSPQAWAPPESTALKRTGAGAPGSSAAGGSGAAVGFQTTGELTSQRPTRAPAGKKRRAGSSGSPQAPPASRC